MDTIPSDPYRALGVPRDANASQIKTAYRKLALKCHPDKAPGKGDEFHSIQQAYEILGDEGRKQKYDDEIRLAELRRDVYGRKGSGGSPTVDIRTAVFDVRSSPHPMATGFTARGPQRVYEERRPPQARTSYDSDFGNGYFGEPRTQSRKHDGFDADTRRPGPPKPSRSEESRANVRIDRTMSTKDKERNERKKQKDREQTRDRRGKYAFAEDEVSSDSEGEGVAFAAARKREQERERDRYDAPRRGARPSEEDIHDERARKYRNQMSEREDYMNRARAAETGSADVGSHSPPSYSRSPSFQQEPPYKSSNAERPSLFRRTSTRPKEREREKEKSPIVEPAPRLFRSTSTANGHRQRSPEVVEPPSRTSSTRRPPPLTTSYSNPSTMRIPSPSDGPRRSNTYTSESIPPPTPGLRRAETMPVHSNPSPTSRTQGRRNDNNPTVSSGLRHYAETNDSGYSTSSPSETPAGQQSWSPPPSSYKQKYRYDFPPSDISTPDYLPPPTPTSSARPATVLREPTRSRHRSPSPPPRARDRAKESVKRQSPPLARSASYVERDMRETPPPPPTRKASVRRPSIQRSDSVRLPSSNGSGGRVPTLVRGGTAPPGMTPLRTSGAGFGFFDEPVLQASPSEMFKRGVAEGLRMKGGDENSRRVGGERRKSQSPVVGGGYGGGGWEEEASGPRRSHTQDSFLAGGAGREREREKERDRMERDRGDRDRERMERERDRFERERERDRGDRDRERERAERADRERGGFVRERPRAPPRRSATYAS